jgi:hypothetical protein
LNGFVAGIFNRKQLTHCASRVFNLLQFKLFLYSIRAQNVAEVHKSFGGYGSLKLPVYVVILLKKTHLLKALLKRLHLLGNTVMIAVGAEYTAIAGQRP